MSALDLDPNYGLPLWQTLIAYFRRHPPVVHAHGMLPAAPRAIAPRRRTRKATPFAAIRRHSYLSCDLERRLPVQPSP